jgi:hypothetical protein
VEADLREEMLQDLLLSPMACQKVVDLYELDDHGKLRASILLIQARQAFHKRRTPRDATRRLLFSVVLFFNLSILELVLHWWRAHVFVHWQGMGA